ncbi:MAG TPA: P1 family peptidase [Firmicutes bacterium]|nr:P1 family peptidase [Bacillota bacterium]
MKPDSVKTARDYNVIVGSLPPGPNNLITDVAGVKVGHCTLDQGSIKTGATAILPHGGNLFAQKVVAAVHVINGFGKSAGIVQIEELGVIETPIILTNTLSVGTAYQAVVEYMLAQNPDIGLKSGTVNPVVGECNDGYLNDIRGCHVQKSHVHRAIENAAGNFAQGSVGAGTGMSCYGLKGGIGSSSRSVKLGNGDYIIGALVLANFGRKEDLLVNGSKVGQTIARHSAAEKQSEDKGSIIVVLATDIPLSARQLRRLCQRAQVGIIRTGSYLGHGSGDIVFGFSTARQVPHHNKKHFAAVKVLNENYIDLLFRAVGEAVEEAILNSLFCAEGKEGREGNRRRSLAEYAHLFLP